MLDGISFADRWCGASDEEKPELLQFLISSTIEAERLRDIPAVMNILRHEYHTDHYMAPIPIVLFYAGPGLHVSRLLWQLCPEHMNEQIDAAFSDATKASTSIQAKRFAILSILIIQNATPALSDQELESLTTLDRGQDQGEHMLSILTRLQTRMLDSRSMTEIEELKLFEKLDQMLTTRTSMDIKLLSLAYASLIRPRKEYSFPYSTVLTKFLSLQQQQWDSDEVTGQVPRSAADLQVDLPRISSANISDTTICDLEPDPHDFISAEAELQYFNRARRQIEPPPRDDYDSIHEICDNRQTLREELFSAMLSVPVIDQAKIAANDAKEKQKQEMPSDLDNYMTEAFDDDCSVRC
ncbi:hypothetical protein Slin15195_G107010 [Septoria linicola]|uniref:Uncharacterized protein n=1 Tax=Septoria linicola TaxID=215465 RepID=A0A9Q9AWV2_9PEZI|nr:hypothetical protein Slin14017_G069980 [Septoria linicola]USW57382.1 hypothetical protein Slin15195_G107010 [Septoria linicola]